VRLNLEIAGIAALGVALLLAVALALPASSGAAGAATAHGLLAAFGRAAWLAPLVVALAGAIVFLEINVPQMIATFGIAALLYFAIVDAAFGRRGGAVGTALARGLHALVGDVGSAIVLVLAAIVVTVWITRLSVKRAIGWSIVALARARNVVAGALHALRPAPARAPSTAVARPGSLREAFGLPPIAPVDVRKFVAQAAPAAPVVPVPAARVQPDDEGDFEGDEDEDFDDDLEDDDEELDDGDFEGDDEEDDEDETVDSAVKAVVTVTPVPVAAIAAPVVVHGGARQYRLPDLALFDPPQVQHVDESSRSHVLEDTLASFGVGAKVVHIERGPSITRYELRPERGVKISRISSLADDIALALAATAVRIEAPIPGKSAVGIEVPNASVSLVAISEILQSLPLRGTVPPLHMALGKDITGRPVFGDLAKMPHLLVAGATGSGKSVCLNGIVASVLACATPDQVQMLMIDPKRVEFAVYDGIPHLIEQVITDPRLAAGALFQMTKEMDSRYERFARAGVRKIEEYNAKFPDETLPYVIILIDELADLMMIAPGKVETTICRIAQLARATGIHLVVATQRPSVDVITGIIKANIPSRIAFAVSSQVDSRTILDMAGAERLLGRGDMLYLPIDAPKPVRAQGALITGAEVSRLVAFWAAQGRPDNLLGVEVAPIEDDERARNADPLAYDAARFIIETNYASTAQLQTRFSIGHPRAVRLMKFLEECGVVGQHEGPKPRRINVGLGELEALADRLGKRDDGQTDLFATGM
jgi:S-DNA-T family DNA segregation ATPase FtsK/SpoIIIE